MAITRGICSGLALVCGLAATVPGATPRPRQSFSAIDAAVRRGIQRGVYPGAVVIIGRRDRVLYARGFGHFTWSRRSPVPRPESTLWDLASLTKVVATTSSVMRLVDAGRVDLEAPVARYLPRFAGGPRDSVTVRMLLDHTSGLRSYLPLFRLATSRAQAIDLLYAEPLSRPPGASAEYSDLNAMLLGLLVESVAGVPLDRFAEREVFHPLRMRDTRFLPPRSRAARIAPTGLVRGQPTQGEVNDLNAAIFGGVAGHAGLFSTGADLARFAQTWLRRGQGPSGPWVSAATITHFLTPGAHSGTRLLGWDTPDSTADEPSVFGRLISAATYGHTGWTGTELWVDPANDLFLVFLTNRSFDPRRRESIKELRLVRSALSNAVARLVPRACPQDLVARC